MIVEFDCAHVVHELIYLYFVCGEIELWMRNIIYFHQSFSSKFDILGCEIVNCYWYLTRTHSCIRRGYSDLHSHYLSTYQKWLGVDSDFWSSIFHRFPPFVWKMVVFQVFWLGWDEVQLDQAVLKKHFALNILHHYTEVASMAKLQLIFCFWAKLQIGNGCDHLHCHWLPKGKKFKLYHYSENQAFNGCLRAICFTHRCFAKRFS